MIRYPRQGLQNDPPSDGTGAQRIALKLTGRFWVKMGCCWLVSENVGYQRRLWGRFSFYPRPPSVWMWTLLSRRRMGADGRRVLVCGTRTGSSWEPGSPPSPDGRAPPQPPNIPKHPEPHTIYPLAIIHPSHCEAHKVIEFGSLLENRMLQHTVQHYTIM